MPNVLSTGEASSILPHASEEVINALIHIGFLHRIKGVAPVVQVRSVVIDLSSEGGRDVRDPRAATPRVCCGAGVRFVV